MSEHSEDMFHKALRLLDAEANEAVIWSLRNIIKNFKRNRGLDERGPTIKYLRTYMLQRAERAERTAGEVLQVELVRRKFIQGTLAEAERWPDRVFALHDVLKEYANDVRELRERLPTKGGRRNLHTMFNGPADWRMARDLFGLYVEQCKKTTRVEFENLFGHCYKHVTGNEAPAFSRNVRDAYRVGRAIHAYNITSNKIRRRLNDPALSKSERAGLTEKLDSLNKNFAELPHPHPL